MDAVKISQHIKRIVQLLKSHRDNPEQTIDEIISDATEIAKKLGLEEDMASMPRIVGRQRHRSNHASGTPSEFWKRSLVIPYLDSIIASLEPTERDKDLTFVPVPQITPPTPLSTVPNLLRLQRQLRLPHTISQSVVELQKANLEAQNPANPGGPGSSTPGSSSSGPSSAGASPLASAIPLAQLLSKPGALNALSSLSALGGLTELLGGSHSSPVQTTGVHRSHKTYTPRLRSPGSGMGPQDNSKLKSERSKFAPY
uniref:(California timema) hypothetical protein n=1 Tax=Timema californicum TaxID=61474 RepID=A0A7R9J1N3_TIMCA|nr:unnamed protein product [Timema californicum]